MSINQLPEGARTMLAETMPRALTDATNSQLKHIFDLTAVSKVRELPRRISDSDYQFIDDFLALMKRFSDYIDEMEEPLSDENRRFLKDSSIKLYALVKRIDEHIEFVRSLSESVARKQEISDKLVNFANEIEDIAEVCELSVDEKFIEMIKGRLQSYFNASSEN